MADVPYPYFGTPQDTQNWLDVQRKQQIAQMLMGSLQSANQTPASWDSMKVVPKRGAVQNLSVLADALLARKGLDAANQSTAGYMSHLYGGDQPYQSQPYDEAAASQAPPGIAAPAPGPDSPSNTPTAPGLAGGGPPSLTGNPSRDRFFMNAMGPEKYMAAVAQRYAFTDQQKNDLAAGITPQQRKVATLSDALRGAVVPNSTSTLSLDPSGNVLANPIPGLQQSEADLAGATTAATEANKPHYEPDPFHPGHSVVTFPTPPAISAAANPATTAAPGGGAPNNAAALEGQKKGAETGYSYAAKLNEDSTSALQGKRTLSEMTNLLQGFTPGAGAPMLSAMGGVAQALGVPADTVAKYTKMNVGDTQAFQKGTAALAAESAKQMTNKVTQQDFKIYLQNNPNWMMTPEGIKRAMDYMDRGFDQPIAKQAAFAAYSKNASPDRWPIDFEANWNKQEAEAIKQGKYNSAPPALSGIRTSTDVAKGPAPKYAEGQVAHNPQTGAALVFRAGRWVPQ